MPTADDPNADSAALRADNAFLRQQVQQLLATVAELRSINDKQQAHIEYLVRQTFGRKSERVAGPTLFDELPDAEPASIPPDHSPAKPQSPRPPPKQPLSTRLP